ncbi:leucine-rich repeat-containing protein 57-like [Stegodyphus dumicola]|uniref:leucine-rich repeat-containing protein 57-like n=1 Tax=Stegodyphus dumicola TaxID=202533 RepID=UPI0015B13E95|nr:leucine-rich repeat-containing protein 57-like [Stegodyphus dumicola]
MGNAIKPHIKNAEKTGVLQLANIGLTEFPRELFQVVGVLRTLDLSNNKIGNIPPSIGQFTNLKNLSASQIRITSLPEEIGTLKKLETVNFSMNELTSLPSSFAQLVNLRTINLSKNKFTELPSVFSNMKRLELLDMSHNKLVEVPDHVKEISAIEINLNQNQIAVLSEAIAECTKLKVLRLEENCLQLQAVPEKILTDSQISLLAIDGNLFEAKDLHAREGWEKYMERFTATKKKLY